MRQKTRWVCGIALQGWDRMGWSGRPIDGWMRLRDRRGPFAALVLFVAYLLIVLSGALLVAQGFGVEMPDALTPVTQALLLANGASLVWRALWRGAFTTREYGIGEGTLSLARIPVSNVIAIMAGRRAVAQYVSSLRGAVLRWDKTEHRGHPSVQRQSPVPT